MAGSNWKMYNVIILGFAFMFIFTAFQTSSMVEQSVIDGAKKDPSLNFTGDGYTSLAIIYAVFGFSNWIAPSIVAALGAKISMICGGLTYGLFVASFLRPRTWSLYLGSVLIGIGAAVIWTGQGKFLTDNSTKETMGRNAGIFWAMLQCSLLIGNLYEYVEFRGAPDIDKHIRTQLYTVLTIAAGAGILLLLILRSKIPADRDEALNIVNETTEERPPTTPLQAFKTSVRLFLTRDMLLLSVCFFYTGLELTFFSGVYGTAVGHTTWFGSDAKSYIGLCGILIGVGEISSGFLFGLLGSKTNKYGRDVIILLGFVLHSLAFFLVFINLPEQSPIKETHGNTYIAANKYVAFVCAFLLGFGDGSFNTQITSILGVVYSDDPAPAFALFKFSQSVAAAIGFFYSDHLSLRWQLLILQITAVLGTYCFCRVEWDAARHQAYEPVNTTREDKRDAPTQQLPGEF